MLLSIVYSLLQLVDPMQAKVVELAHEARREEPGEDALGDNPGDRYQPPPRTPVPYACRVCDHRSTERAFCPKCLADTMQPLRRR